MKLFDGWLRWAARSRIPAFVRLAATIRRRRTEIELTLALGLTNAALESANTKIRLIIRRAFGFHTAEAAVALVPLCLGGLCPPLPGR